VLSSARRHRMEQTARFSVGSKRTVNIENSRFRIVKFHSDKRLSQRLEILASRKLDNKGAFPNKKCCTGCKKCYIALKSVQYLNQILILLILLLIDS